MRRILITAATFFLTTAAFAQDLDKQTAATLLPQARQEGKVTVYAFTSRIGQVEKTFEATYPGIDMITFDMSSTEQIARIKSRAIAYER